MVGNDKTKASASAGSLEQPAAAVRTANRAPRRLSIYGLHKNPALANSTVAQMTIDEKIGIVKGTGQLSSTRKFHLLFQICPAYMSAQAAAWVTLLQYRVLGFRPSVSKTVLLVCAW